METTPVKFEFRCLTPTGYKNLNFTRALPSSLITTSPLPDHTQVLHAHMVPILQEHDFACKSACAKVCNVCGKEAHDVHIMPMLHLRKVDDPSVDVYVHAVCGKPECEVGTREGWQKGLAEMESRAIKEGLSKEQIEGTKGAGCGVCGIRVGAKECSRCRLTSYCGKEHQAKDWPSHKKICKRL